MRMEFWTKAHWFSILDLDSTDMSILYCKAPWAAYLVWKLHYKWSVLLLLLWLVCHVLWRFCVTHPCHDTTQAEAHTHPSCGDRDRDRDRLTTEWQKTEKINSSVQSEWTDSGLGNRLISAESNQSDSHKINKPYPKLNSTPSVQRAPRLSGENGRCLISAAKCADCCSTSGVMDRNAEWRITLYVANLLLLLCSDCNSSCKRTESTHIWTGGSELKWRGASGAAALDRLVCSWNTSRA